MASTDNTLLHSFQLEATYPKTRNIIRKHRLWRLLEIIPGFLAWTGLLLPFILSFFSPALVASFMIIYVLTWLFRSIKLAVNLFRSYLLSQKAFEIDWAKMISFNDYPEKLDNELRKINQQQYPKKYFQMFHILQKVRRLQKTNQWLKSKDIYQAIIFVTCKEPYEVIYESIKSYARSDYPLSNIIFILAGEETDKENFLILSKNIQNEFGNVFGHFMITLHPSNLPGEIKGKSANATWAARKLKSYIDREKIPYDHVIVSNFDADSVAHPNYFLELTYKYLTTDRRTEKGYQPTHMFHNNIWDVPMMVRMVALSCTFWRMAESMEIEKYKSFSSRSLSFQTLVEVNYWDPAVIPEDSRQYWTAYTIYNGRHTLVPIYSPIYMDAVLSDTYFKTFCSQYKQLRRWAWGVCDFPFVVLNLYYNPHFTLSKKIFCVAEFLERSFFWATSGILITCAAFIPGFINPAFRQTVLAYNLPHVVSDILTLSSIGILICTILSLIVIPYNPKRKWFGQFLLCAQWIFVPIVSIFLSAIPALDAQTRLVFGKYLEYNVTKKVRKPLEM